jgi:hypothetical protein
MSANLLCISIDLAHKSGISAPSLIFRRSGKEDFFVSSARILFGQKVVVWRHGEPVEFTLLPKGRFAGSGVCICSGSEYTLKCQIERTLRIHFVEFVLVLRPRYHF